MLLVNRTALVVKPKQPYIDWANSLDSSSDGPVLSLEDPELDHNVYLVDEVIDPDELQEQLRRHYRTIFENELRDWHLLEADWPQGRDFEMFEAWFTVETHSVVIDLSDYELEVEDV